MAGLAGDGWRGVGVISRLAGGGRHGALLAMLPPILHEDDALLAFDKPSGLLIAPDRWDKTRANLMTLVHAKLGDHVANVHRVERSEK